MRYLLVLLAAGAWAIRAPAGGQEAATPAGTFSAAQAHRAKYTYTRVQPLLDVPMIDPAITRGPDGRYYLTGTTAAEKSEAPRFTVNDGIRLWRSGDLKQWENLGLVAPLSLVKAKVEDLGLLRTAREADEMQGLLAPEIHFVKGGVYLTYSLKPCGTGLLRSRTGGPEGPYEDVGLITREGADASLFEDEDGKVYWVFGGGWIARMNDAMTALAERPRLVEPHDRRQDLPPGAQILQVGQGGAFLFRKDGRYHLLAAGIHGRLGVPCYDTWVATAKSLAGPWSRRKLSVPHGGQSTMFEGPEGQWYATFSGVDCRAAVRERAAIVPVDWVDSVGYWGSKGEPWPWKRDTVITEAWGWENARPVSDYSYRDPVGVNGGDGSYYLTGLHNFRSHGRGVRLLRGKDLTGVTPWEAIPLAGFRTVDDIPWFKNPEKPSSFLVSFCKIFRAQDTFWISLGVPGGKRVLRSESGTLQGPWRVAAKPPDPEPSGRAFHGSIPFEDYEGNLYGRWDTLLWPAKPDFSEADPARVPPTEEGYKIPFDQRLKCYVWESTDGSALFRGDVPAGHVYKVDGRYLMIGGAGWHGDYRSFGTYDSEVFWSTKPGGPWHPNYTVLPHGGNTGIFQDNDGGWWFVSFANDNLLPDRGLLRCLPLEIRWNGAGYDIGPRHKQEPPFVHRPSTRSVIADAVSRIRPAYPILKLPSDIVIQDPNIATVRQGDRTTYYLTGTVPSSGAPGRPGSVRFMDNDGVYLWKSPDLERWDSLGRVASLAGGPDNLGKNSAFHPANYFFSPPDRLEPLYTRGIIAPKLAAIRGDYYIVFLMSRQKIGLLKSTSGRPEGPYALWGPVAGHGTTCFLADTGIGPENNTDSYLFAYDPGLFVDDDGTVYCVFGPGWIAPLSKDMKAFAERPRLLEMEAAQTGAGGQPLYAGKGGCQIFKKDGKYHLLAANGWGDVIERTADALHGPYGGARIAFAQGAPAHVFVDGEGRFRALTGIPCDELRRTYVIPGTDSPPATGPFPR